MTLAGAEIKPEYIAEPAPDEAQDIAALGRQ